MGNEANASSMSTNHHQHPGSASSRKIAIDGMANDGGLMSRLQKTSSTGLKSLVPFFGTAPKGFIAKSMKLRALAIVLYGPSVCLRAKRLCSALVIFSLPSTADE
jgi:hypothetical protein